MMRMEVSDESLAAAAAGGDADAFRLLVERNYDLIFRVSFRLFGKREDAEDLAQDICAALPAKLGSYRRDARFSTWLYRVVTNAGRDRMRRRATRRKAAAGWGETHLLALDEAAEAKAELDWLTRAMQSLKPELRETVALVLGEDMTHGQAAESLEVSEGTVSWRMSEVKRHLRDLNEMEGAGA